MVRRAGPGGVQTTPARDAPVAAATTRTSAERCPANKASRADRVHKSGRHCEEGCHPEGTAEPGLETAELELGTAEPWPETAELELETAELDLKTAESGTGDS